jgi:hypothetical protein
MIWRIVAQAQKMALLDRECRCAHRHSARNVRRAYPAIGGSLAAPLPHHRTYESMCTQRRRISGHASDVDVKSGASAASRRLW